MRIRLSKIFHFEMAHALPGYDGLCRHIHGHSFRLEVCILGEALQAAGHPKNGMVIDFKDLKKIVNEAFVNEFDHALVLPESVDKNVLKTLDQHFGRVLVLPFQPTCENLIALCVERLRGHMPAGVQLYSVRISETSSSFAEWCLQDEL